MIALLLGCRAKNTWIDRLRDISMAIYMLTDRSCVADLKMGGSKLVNGPIGQ